MTVKDRILALGKLGDLVKSETWLEEIIPAARAHNNWFTKETITQSITAIAEQFLDVDKLTGWVSSYELDGLSPKRVALILSGNIPAVGFHDVLSVLISGHKVCVKLSSKDTVLIRQAIKDLINIEPRFEEQVEFISKVENVDAIIATGSNNTSLYFEHYFSKYPHIIRKNRKSVAIIYPETTDDELREMASDILSYYGLGCRNVSKVFIHEDVDRAHLMEIWNEFNQVILHNKYKNNYDYNYAVYLLNKEDFLMNGALVLRPHESLHSRIASLHYETFSDVKEVENKLVSQIDELQCIVSAKTLGKLPIVGPGQAQRPALADYADHVDTLEFLKAL